MGRVLIENSVALVLLLSVEFALELTDADFHAVSSRAAARHHVAVEKTRCGRKLPVENVGADGKACVELRHLNVKTAAFLGGN